MVTSQAKVNARNRDKDNNVHHDVMNDRHDVMGITAKTFLVPYFSPS